MILSVAQILQQLTQDYQELELFCIRTLMPDELITQLVWNLLQYGKVLQIILTDSLKRCGGTAVAATLTGAGNFSVAGTLTAGGNYVQQSLASA